MVGVESLAGKSYLNLLPEGPIAAVVWGDPPGPMHGSHVFSPSPGKNLLKATTLP